MVLASGGYRPVRVVGGCGEQAEALVVGDSGSGQGIAPIRSELKGFYDQFQKCIIEEKVSII